MDREIDENGELVRPFAPEAASAVERQVRRTKTDFEYVMDGLSELAEHTGPNDAAQYALAAMDMKKELDRYKEALAEIAMLRFKMGWFDEAKRIASAALDA